MHEPFDRTRSRPAMSWPTDAAKHSQKDATYIVIGNPHGGTTLIAGLLRTIGIFMGHQIDSWTQEDVAMRINDKQSLITTIKNRNAEFSQWGWKRPGSVEYLDTLIPFVREPRIILLLRDPYATTLRNITSGNEDSLVTLRRSISDTQRQFELINRLSAPTLFISYEMALKRPNFLIEDLILFLGKPNIDASLKEELLSYISLDGGYKGNVFRSAPLPIVEQFPKALEPVKQNLQELEFVRPYGVQRQGFEWKMNLDDPHFFVSDENVVRLPGRRRIRLNLELRSKQSIEPSIYLDIGHGLREEHRIRFGKLGSGVWDFVIDFPQTTSAVRFDPDETKGTIEKLLVSISY